MMNKGIVVVLSAPSGCGKDTVFKELCKLRDDIVESVSATTRLPRDGEIDGVNYFFMTEEQFEDLINNDGLLEYTKYNNFYYGTPVKGVEDAINDGKVCFLIIEVTGGQNIMKRFPECVSIFLLPPSIEELERRLRGRKTDSEEAIMKRLAIAEEEMKNKVKYTYNVVNDELEACVNEINKIISDELVKHNK